MPQNAENACFVSVLHKTRKNFPHGCRLQKMAGSAMKDRQEGRCRPPMAAEKRSRNRNSRPNLILSVSLACIFRFLMNKAIRLQLLPNNLQYHFLFSITSGILYFFLSNSRIFPYKIRKKNHAFRFPQLFRSGPFRFARAPCLSAADRMQFSFPMSGARHHGAEAVSLSVRTQRPSVPGAASASAQCIHRLCPSS